MSPGDDSTPLGPRWQRRSRTPPSSISRSATGTGRRSSRHSSRPIRREDHRPLGARGRPLPRVRDTGRGVGLGRRRASVGRHHPCRRRRPPARLRQPPARSERAAMPLDVPGRGCLRSDGASALADGAPSVRLVRAVPRDSRSALSRSDLRATADVRLPTGGETEGGGSGGAPGCAARSPAPVSRSRPWRRLRRRRVTASPTPMEAGG